MILTIIMFIIIFTAIVVVHELGHFLFARLFGVTVLEFAIGFGPVLYKKKLKSGMDFLIKWFPLGGYVKMDGEDPTEVDDSVYADKKSGLYYSKSAWQRFFIALAGPLFSILAGYLMLAVVALFWGIPQVGIDTVDLSSPAYTAGIRDGDIISGMNGRILFDLNEISDTIKNTEGSVELTLTRNGERVDVSVTPAMFPEQYNIIIKGNDLPSDILLKDVQTINGIALSDIELTDYTEKEVEVVLSDGSILTGTLSGFQKIISRKAIGITFATLSNRIKKAVAPFKDGDEIISINGNSITNGNDIITLLRIMDFPADKTTDYNYIEIRGTQILDFNRMKSLNLMNVSVKRGDETVAMEIPREEFLSSLGQCYFVSPVENLRTANPLIAIGWGFEWGNNLLRRMGQIIANIFTGEQKISEFSGPVGIINIIGQATDAGFESLVLVFALITLNLGIINLIPLPALDGGRIVFNLIEMLIRRRINPVIEGYIHAVGFFFIMGLAVYVTYFDILRFMR